MAAGIDIPGLNKYIPAGCLKLSVDGTGIILPPEFLGDLKPQIWKFFSRGLDDIPEPICLPGQAQDALLRLPLLQPFIVLWQSRWIQMSFGLASDLTSSGRIRVYILPQDVDRSIIEFKNDLSKVISFLISQLDFSSKSWNGEEDNHEEPGPQSDHLLDVEHTSLLTMFNSVPSPNPLPELEAYLDTRDGMQCLLESQVPGLTTKLYPYQGRSAALMLQREESPGRIIDPRFRSVLDQEGRPWYYDDVSGMVLREPRYYDGVRGGILAEEMGTGKTLICLALILCTKSEPTKVPEPFVAEVPPRLKIASLLDMAAATANKHSVAWKPYFEASAAQFGFEYQNCIDALTRPENRAIYKIRNALVEPRRSNRTAPRITPPKEVYLSHATLLIVPNNLVKQWQNEIKKHTTGLNTLVLVDRKAIPPLTSLLNYDLILFSESRFEWIQKENMVIGGSISDFYCPLNYIRFKRCIIDEGHKLGNNSRSWKNDVMRVLDRLEIAARWVVTGTPSRGLYGVEQQQSSETRTAASNEGAKVRMQSTLRQEREDLQRIGNLVAKYLKVRPWANTKDEVGDSVADWNTYVMHQKQHSKGHNRKDCLRTALNSLIIRHQLSDISTLLPPVEEKIVLLDGSYQDKLSLNLFSMMIIFNSVQSQRTDMDYFFHERQRKSLGQLVRNLRQACFFGGVFYSAEDIAKALETAEEFLEKKDIPISNEDVDLLTQAIDFGKIAVKNRLKDVSNKFHAMPLYINNFPGGSGKNWSLDDSGADGQLICTDAGMIHALQKFLNPCIDAPTSLQLMIESGRLDQQGAAERSQALMAAMDASGYVATQHSQASALAGNTALGGDYHAIPKSGSLGKKTQPLNEDAQGVGMGLAGHIKVAEPLAKTAIISTVSAKLSYLIDSIVKYQGEEQIIVFYDNENVAYYLAGVLDILQIHYLIYARAGLSAERRAQYVATFTHNQKFRVLLMDISQAAFGLDMRSASRIYFISPVLNPQVEAQAIGRARRISQQKPVSVETLVLRNSIEEVIVNRRKQMTHAEHSKVKSILDDRLIYRWILNAKIVPLPDEEDGVAQTAMLETPQYVFGRGFGRELHPDEGLVTGSPDGKTRSDAPISTGKTVPILFRLNKGLKRTHDLSSTVSDPLDENTEAETLERPSKRNARVTFAV
ncbi:P-loop containing nucleoside triphosphate hydrolase protein [Daldinia caldariorum]|uniref:P-loop containing nucleoside triphosphate hydrolase protein n=1 Tax=Daldinia caldariorum TaxID=326644 RepID=UPI0020085CED|nr:P-loop containing nucleoside triphosphate hydrolase protein [Daldinia caldariorum]KAI1467516.1 P-loop containing nucleoside triphosphate hydrolase protein [Daldinia caldariorum]